MSDAISIATNALSSTGSRIAKTTASIVNASSTGSGDDLTKAIIGLTEDKTTYAAEAKVVSAVAKDNKTLLDILA